MGTVNSKARACCLQYKSPHDDQSFFYSFKNYLELVLCAGVPNITNMLHENGPYPACVQAGTMQAGFQSA